MSSSEQNLTSICILFDIKSIASSGVISVTAFPFSVTAIIIRFPLKRITGSFALIPMFAKVIKYEERRLIENSARRKELNEKMLVEILKSFSTLNFSAQQGEKLEIEGDALHLLDAIEDIELDTDTATEKGIERKEKMFGIVPSVTDTLEERRFRIQIKERIIRNMNFGNLERLIKDIAGEKATVERDERYKNVTVRVPLSSKKNLKTVD